MADKIGTDEYGEILIYQTDDGQTNIEVKIEDDTVWLTQQQLTELYQCSKSNISEHIKHIFEEGELDKDSVVRKFRTTTFCFTIRMYWQLCRNHELHYANSSTSFHDFIYFISRVHLLH